MRSLRISAISYLNTAPLMWDFQLDSHPLAENAKGWATHFEISYTLPSGCARALAQGTADIGIIPAAAYAEIPGLQILPDVTIASKRAVRSILLVSKVPPEQVRTVALDTSSMTSVALLKVLFEKHLGGTREYRAMDPDLQTMLAECDAGLLIGDPALQVDRSRYQTLDLAEEWIRFTGKPFVFAFWAVRGDALREADPALDLGAIFRESRDRGLKAESLNHIACEWAPKLGLTEDQVRDYLTQNIHYQLDDACIEGLKLFYKYASEIGVLPTAPELRFAEAANVAPR